MSDYDILKDFEKCNTAFEKLTTGEARQLLKALSINTIDGSWGDGMIHLARIRLLCRAFPEDNLLEKIYRHLEKRLKQFTEEVVKGELPLAYFSESALRDQPCVYKEKGTYDGDDMYEFDVNDNKLAKEIEEKYPEYEDVISQLWWF